MKYTRENPSPEYVEAVRLGKEFHQRSSTFTGRHSWQSFARLKSLIQETSSKTLCDYGCGKGDQFTWRDIRLLNHKDDTEKQVYPTWQEALGVEYIYPYDPCVPQYEKLPDATFDGVLTTDALEHIPPQDQPWVIDELFSFADKFVYATIACYPGKKTLADGSLAHKSIKPLDWWVALWWETAKRHPLILWDIRVECDIAPLTHRAFRGKGEEWVEMEPWWKCWKPAQIETLTEKQRIEMEQAERTRWFPANPRVHADEFKNWGKG